ncbi:hypothetical protein CHLNCDRAFT_58696 [Chlorella variabilis]|uniref:DUF7880 domain-containing protein n=1 Tax=Chlorella variabilis TaxID=554065 RepID=E1ZMC8_CHLVA|nr:hypothetical protein CHLNCDRAFT_58696 [Chlorella variabilis]EFN53088.1 hypothetical protein CHLNCDRAFT_58696 [Chlorella variabilis]|eukprot:XP_005845190.1 hypothetical protein CHLNCDRAFT_58696 [Chlorella variabilis]
MLCLSLASVGGLALAGPHRQLPRARHQARKPTAAAASQPAPLTGSDAPAVQQAPPSSAAVRRRAALASALAAAVAPWLLSGAAHADNDAVKAGLSKYVKKKKLERIDTYIAPLLEAKGQLVRVGRVMLQDPAAARQLLRSGVFAGLRDNVRSVGEYASQRSNDESGRELVRGFFDELEGFDSALRQAQQREGEGLEEARKRLDGTVVALDKLLATVPETEMQKAQRVVEAIELLDGEAGAEETAASQLDKLL